MNSHWGLKIIALPLHIGNNAQLRHCLLNALCVYFLMCFLKKANANVDSKKLFYIFHIHV